MTHRSTGMNRRQFLRAGSVTPLAVAGLGGTPAMAAAGPPHPVLADGAIDLAAPATALFTHRYLTCVRTVMQSFAVDPGAGHVYVLQIVQANTPLPGDEPGDEAYARRTERGDLALTKLDMSGHRLGHMYLKHFGHGVSMGLEHDGDQVFLWTEIDTLPNAAGDGRGSRLTRFPFTDGAVLDAERDADLYRRELIAGATQTTCTIDPVNQRLAMRYYRDGEFRYALFDLAHVKQERPAYEPVFDVGTPAEVDGVFQGYASLGDHLYMMVGTKYGAGNPPPPEGVGDAALTRLRWSTGEVDAHTDEQSGLDLHRREPEGLAVALTTPGRSGSTARATARLYSGFATSAHESPDADRLCTLFYRSSTGR
ncbi:teichoic acid biosynthesis protein C [Ruania alba]|uniref:P68 RBP/TagC-like beta-propeller domain-containing protein n=1 Tax=Ruania alba TaxID=648782 RepID=A0A1H5M0D8_9MICO|nr:teichoic acid biosynthesis protein C [Ruania alba]SEE82779.1 hypothetical protein SAMN04488554_3082 [Ruania alba]